MAQAGCKFLQKFGKFEGDASQIVVIKGLNTPPIPFKR